MSNSNKRTAPAEYEEMALAYLRYSETELSRENFMRAQVYATNAASYATLALFAVQRLGSPAYYEQEL